MKRNLLSGNVRRQLVQLALPLFLGCLLQQLYNTVDSLVVGRFLGTDAFASTGVSGTVMNLFIFVLNGFCVGAGILFGQEYGAGRKDDFRRCVFTALAAGTLLTVLFSVLSISLLGPLLRAIDTPEELIPYCKSYLRLILGGLLLTFLYNLFSSVLRSMGDTRAALRFLAVSAGLNIVLDLVFICLLRWGIAGAAGATVLAQGVSAFCCYVYLRRRYPDYCVSRRDAGFYPAVLGPALRLGLVSALHQSSLYIGKLLVQGAVNTLGTSGIAAFTAASRIEGVLGTFADSISQSISIHISQNFGAGNRDRVYRAMKNGMGLLHLLFLLLLPLTWIFASPLTDLFLNGADPLALEAGAKYLRAVAPFYLLGFTGYGFVGFFRGTGRILIPFLATTLQLTCRVILSYLMVGRLGLPAVGWATGIGWIVIVLFHVTMFLRTRRKDFRAS